MTKILIQIQFSQNFENTAILQASIFFCVICGITNNYSSNHVSNIFKDSKKILQMPKGDLTSIKKKERKKRKQPFCSVGGIAGN